MCKSEISKAASLLGKRGGMVRSERLSAEEKARIAAMGGKKRRELHTPEELREFARNAGRKPWKITPAVRQYILARLEQGRPHREIAAEFGISLRAIGRLKAQKSKLIVGRKEVTP